MKNFLKIITTVCTIFFINQIAFTATHYVNINNATPAIPYTNWSSAATIIQDAIDAASVGDTVLVSNGIYSAGGGIVSSSTYSLSNRVVAIKDVLIKSVNGYHVTTILGEPDPLTGDFGDRATRCAFISNGAELVGFTLSNGYGHTKLFLELGAGGGAYVGTGGLVSNCLAIANSTHGHGGGMLCANGGKILSCTIQGNSANNRGGGVALMYGGIVSNCTIRDNKSSMYGGGVFLSEGILADCMILGNTSSDQGGGVYSMAEDVSNCEIRMNTTEKGGGGIYFNGGAKAVRCIIANNTATNSGGGISTLGGCVVESCLIVNNKTDGLGGGASLTTGCTIRNCTISGNSASNRGGLSVSSDSTVVNSIIYYNSAPVNPNYLPGLSGTKCESSCILPYPADGVNCITNDPEFINPAAEDYSLHSSSICLDTGTNMDWMTTALDIVGNERIFNVTVDFGAYESRDLRCRFPDNFATGTVVALPFETVDFAGIVAGTNIQNIFYQWDFQNDGSYDFSGFVSTTSWQYSGEGLFSVRLTVSNSIGQTATFLNRDYVHILPEPVFIFLIVGLLGVWMIGRKK